MKNHAQLLPSFFLKSSHTLRLLGAAGIVALGFALPASGQFTPGGGGAIPNLPELKEPGSSVTSLWVSQTDRENYVFTSGNRPVLDLKFQTPESYGATGFDLQKSVDGVTAWETLHSTAAASQDNFSFDPGGDFYFRLLVRGGPRDGQVSNVIEGEVSLFPTQFSGWGGGSNWTPDGPMAPWLGHELIAYFNVRNLSDGSQVMGGIDFQWYRRNPQTGEMTLIPGATQDTFTTSEDDLGGYQLICRGTGDGLSVGGYAQVMMDSSVVMFNNSAATLVTRSGFTLNLFKSVPSLTASDLILTYWNGSETVEIPVSSVSAQAGNTVFDIEANIPAGVTDTILSNRSGVWQIGMQFGEGDFIHQVPGLNIAFPAADGITFGEWADESGIPADRRDPLDRNGPLMVQNLMAYAMGLNPMTVTKNEMPETAAPDPVAGTIHLIYRRAKNLSGTTLTPRISTDLDEWSPANVVSETILEDGGDWEKVDATVEFTPGPAAFFNFAAEQTP